MDNAVQAIMMAFGVLVLVIALSISVYMFSQVTAVSERLLYFADKTNYYDEIEYDYTNADVKNFKGERQVDLDTIIPTLYRYYKENFCVKIYGETGGSKKLIQIFDVDLENKVATSVKDNNARSTSTDIDAKEHYALNQIYNKEDKQYYMFGAPWTGSAEDRKKRIDYFINGDAGYINETYVNYNNNKFAEEKNTASFTEQFVSYSYSGDTFVTEDGDELVNSMAPKDKIVIIYTMKY